MFMNISELKPADIFMFPNGEYAVMSAFTRKVFPGNEVRCYVNDLGFLVPCETVQDVWYCGTLSELGEIKNRPMEK